jgi:hypothetical protein
MAEVAERTAALIAPYLPRTDDESLRPDGARRVMYLDVALPIGERS